MTTTSPMNCEDYYEEGRRMIISLGGNHNASEGY
jgi:hypothetical protein